MTTRSDAEVVATMRRRVPWILALIALGIWVFLGPWIAVVVMVAGLGGAVVHARHLKRKNAGVFADGCDGCRSWCLASTGLDEPCNCGCEAHP